MLRGNNRPLHCFFEPLIRAIYRISIDTTGKSALKLVNLPSMKVVCQERAKI